MAGLTRSYDIAVLGSGFAGSLMAMIAYCLGYSVVLLERGRHPRVVIGESSTPLSNLLLEELSLRYDLPALKPLTKWGTWQKTYPEVACGLKRGFTFYHHDLRKPAPAELDRDRQLLVAASPHDEIADTHWYRADFDALLVKQAQTLGVDYLDEVRLELFRDLGSEILMEGHHNDRPLSIRAKFVIDGTGPRGFLHGALQLPEAAFPGLPATQALYSHFSGVTRPDTKLQSTDEPPPYPPEDAAVHHIFDGGWIWVLRFNNDITSAGVAATSDAAARLRLSDGASSWKMLLEHIPSLESQFTHARAEQPFTYVQQVSFLCGIVCGDRWALLPSATGFVDPLLSTGFPLTLLGIARLAEALECGLGSRQFRERMRTYATRTHEELIAAARLIAALYANMSNFKIFAVLSLLYFAAASYSEAARRLNKRHLASSFLLHDHPTFGAACRNILEQSLRVDARTPAGQVIEQVMCAIEPIDVAGLSNPARCNWFPARAEDMLASASKLESTL